jgi:hypothetical protein
MPKSRTTACSIASVSAFFEGNQESSNRDGFPSWMGATKAGLLGTPTGSVSTRKRVALKSAKGHEQTSRNVHVISVLPLKADIRQREWHVRYVPEADIAIDAWLL